ncbi:MAG: hypothetical protein KZQ93_19095 [Candidatus Thiodiazotropha sp. (ex Monitilora ramsayi)]|nr:hypothetical protein [Candidatus Thiodiazotropha sp. (ex Monitilora ramsayi)]
MEIDVPWWGYAYLITFFVISALGGLDELDRKNGWLWIAGDAFTYIIIVICVISFANEWVAKSIGIWLLLLVLVGVIFDFISSLRTLKLTSLEEDFSKLENEIVRMVGMTLGAVFILSGYTLGILAWLKVRGA